MTWATAVDIFSSFVGLSSFVILFSLGGNIKNALGDSIYNVFVFLLVIIGLWGTSSFFSLLSRVFGELWLFSLGQYTSLALIFVILIAKVMRWF